MEAQFRLVLHEDLARQLAKDPELNARLVAIEGDRVKPLRLGLPEASAAIVFLGAVAELTKVCLEIAIQMMKWMKERKERHVSVLVEGPRNDVLIEINENSNSADIAEKIHNTVIEE